MPLKINVCRARLAGELDGAAYGLPVQLGEAAPGVLPIEPDAARRIAAAVRSTLLARLRDAEHAFGDDEDDLLLVAVPDAALAADIGRVDGFEACVDELIEACVQECVRASADARPRIDVGVVESFALGRDGAGEPREPLLALPLARRGERPTESHVLPLVVVVNESHLEALDELLLDRLGITELDGPIGRAVADALRPRRVVEIGEPTELGSSDDDADFELPEEDMPFIYMASDQEDWPGARALHDPQALVDALPALQRRAAAGDGAQFAYSNGVVVVATADTVYVGFKTVDDLGRLAEIARRAAAESGAAPVASEDRGDGGDDDESPGDAIASAWIDWYASRYQRVMGAVHDGGFRVAAFPLRDWGATLERHIAKKEPFEPGRGLLRPLEEIHIETSDHELVDGAEGAFVVTRLMVADYDDEDSEDEADDGDEDAADAEADEDDTSALMALCGSVRIVAADGSGVSQQNLYATKPAGMVELGRYIEQFMHFPNLPIRPGIQNLIVCDEHLRLTLPIDETELQDPGDDDDELPDLKSMRDPSAGKPGPTH